MSGEQGTVNRCFLTPFYTFIRFFQNYEFFLQNHGFFKITNFLKSRLFSKITYFLKSRDFPGDDVILDKITASSKSRLFQNHGFFKITAFSHSVRKSPFFHTFGENHGFCTLLQNSILFQNFRVFKKFPFKVHSGIPRLTTCKKSRFSVQDLGFRL